MQDLPNPVSFDTALEKFRNHLKSHNRSSATSVAYSSDLTQLKRHLESHRITQATTVSAEHLEAYIADLQTQNYTPKSVSRKINSLKTFFSFLHSQNLIPHNPSHSLTHPKYETKPPRILNPQEIKNLRDAARLDIRISAIIELLLQTGMRISELANIHLDDVKKNDLYIRSAENNPSRTIGINKAAAAAIQNYSSLRPKVADSHLFVTKTGRPLLIRNIRTAIDRYFKKADIKNAKVNDLRHSFIAHQLKNGVHPNIVHKHIGHRRLSSTQKYLEYIAIDVTEVQTRLLEL
jgi:site-specific recombinase XerD